MSSPRPATVIVLAAGEGTRMRSATPKVLHAIGGRSLLGHAVAAARSLTPEHLVVVVGHGREHVVPHLAEIDPSARAVVQERQLGTGHAVGCALAALPPLTGTVVVTYGDVPLLAAATLHELVARHEAMRAAVTVLTARVADPTGYGRVLRSVEAAGGAGDPAGADGTGGAAGAAVGPSGSVERIVEHADADESVRAIREINSGIYAFAADVLASALGRLSSANAQGELYLTDVLGIARAGGGRVEALLIDDPWQTEGVNDRVQLARLGAELNRRELERWMRAGVTVQDPATTWVDVDVRLAADVVLLPGVQLLAGTVVDSGSVIGPDSTLIAASVGAGAKVVRSHVDSALIGPGASVGPFSYLRPGTVLGERSKVGAYVETKSARIGAGSKVPHLSYVGDAEIGEGSNIGAATIFVNYDGVAKHRTVIGDHVRVGSDTMLVAPLTVGDGAYTAAGSVITRDVPPGALAVARGHQRTMEGWVARRRAGSLSAAAAAAAATAAAAGAGADDGDNREDAP